MPKEIKHWTLGNDANGDVQLNIHIDGEHYTLAVHEKDVQSMQNTLDVKAILAQTKIDKNTQRVRVVTNITDGITVLAEAGETLTVHRDYNRIGQPQVLRNANGKHICDVNSHTAKTQCLVIE